MLDFWMMGVLMLRIGSPAVLWWFNAIGGYTNLSKLKWTRAAMFYNSISIVFPSISQIKFMSFFSEILIRIWWNCCKVNKALQLSLLTDFSRKFVQQQNLSKQDNFSTRFDTIFDWNLCWMWAGKIPIKCLLKKLWKQSKLIFPLHYFYENWGSFLSNTLNGINI